MRVFVSGATGYLGSGLLRALRRAGHAAVGLARSKEKTESAGPLGAEWVIGNLRDPESYREAAAACEAIVHVASESGPEVEVLDRQAIDAFVRGARASGSRRIFVYTSGVWALGNTGDRPVDETAPTDHPAAAVAWRPSHERAVLEAAAGTLVTAVVRPGMVYGGTGGMFGALFAKSAREGAPTLVGDGRNRWSSVHLDDLSDLYLRVLEQAWTIGYQGVPALERLFHAVDGAPARTGEIARAASLAAGRDGTVRTLPLEESRAKMGAFADALTLDQVVFATRSERELGWRPRVRGFVPNAGEMFEEWSRGALSRRA